jgi:hypothetical protein
MAKKMINGRYIGFTTYLRTCKRCKEAFKVNWSFDAHAGERRKCGVRVCDNCNKNLKRIENAKKPKSI